MLRDPFRTLSKFTVGSQSYSYFRLQTLQDSGLTDLRRLPFSIRILLESLLRQIDGSLITEQHVRDLAGWESSAQQRPDVPFLPARIVMQDFTGVPAIVDLAAMRAALARLGGDPQRINPLIPVDLVIDHSVQVDYQASPQALSQNAAIEFERNRERYEFLRWGKEAFASFRVVPPATGIVHQVNLEYLSSVVASKSVAGQQVAFPDTLVGTDSHTTMINGLGVLGWGVGGIEAEAAMLGQPMVIVAPDVVGMRFSGKLREGTTATDLVLSVTQVLRAHGVVGKFVEYFGPGMANLSLPDRATIANMAPEYGATAGFFPVDAETLRYLELSGRSKDQLALVAAYCQQQGLFRTNDNDEIEYSEVLEFDLASVEPSLAGPKRPHDRRRLSEVKSSFQSLLRAPTAEGGFALDPQLVDRRVEISFNGAEGQLRHGSVVIAAITSCTNTSNPSVMVAAGLLARNAAARGLKPAPHVRTSLAPGSMVVTEYLQAANLLEPLAALGFDVVGYGCTTCIGNSGPLDQPVVEAIQSADLVVSAVLSGNRNYEGRINPHVRASFLASPPLVVAFALAGRMDIDLFQEPLGHDRQGKPVFLREVWPSLDEIQQVVGSSIDPQMFRQRYADVFTGNPTWNAIPVTGGDLYNWSPESTYIQEPPFFFDLDPQPAPISPLRGARVLLLLGHTVTTDHISPAGAIPLHSPAGQYLVGLGIEPVDFNTFGTRRGNDQVMTRGTFGNIRLRNLMVPGVEGGVTLHLPGEEQMSVFEAAKRYSEENVPLVIFAGKEYGTGSSRDWAAKGTSLLGVRAVIAESYERIHRSNLIGMGVLPLEFMPGEGAAALGLNGHETVDIAELSDALRPGDELEVRVSRPDGWQRSFQVKVRIDTPIEVTYYRNGGILHTVLRQMLAG